MCFFKPPKVTMPTVADKPTITETTAPEPAAPVLGGLDSGAPEVATSSKKTGVSSVKIKPTMAKATGANLGLKPSM